MVEMEIGSLNPAIGQRHLNEKVSGPCVTAALVCLGLNHIFLHLPMLRSPGTGRKKEAFEEGVLPGNLATERHQRNSKRFWESFGFSLERGYIVQTDRLYG